MKKLLFNKETDGRWFVDLPDWKGSKADLEMISGADTMLDIIAQGDNKIYLNVSKENFIFADKIIFQCEAIDIGNGAYYKLESYNGIPFNLKIWLCNVVLFVFEDRFPQKLYFSKA